MGETYFRDVHAARAAWLILIIAAATIAGAWIFQAFGYAPCELCLSERIPYYVGVPWPRRRSSSLCAVAAF